MKVTVVNYGYPIYQTVVVPTEEGNCLDASEKADKFIKEQGFDLNGVQISCFGVYNDIKIL